MMKENLTVSVVVGQTTSLIECSVYW